MDRKGLTEHSAHSSQKDGVGGKRWCAALVPPEGDVGSAVQARMQVFGQHFKAGATHCHKEGGIM